MLDVFGVNLFWLDSFKFQFDAINSKSIRFKIAKFNLVSPFGLSANFMCVCLNVALDTVHYICLSNSLPSSQFVYFFHLEKSVAGLQCSFFHSNWWTILNNWRKIQDLNKNKRQHADNTKKNECALRLLFMCGAFSLLQSFSITCSIIHPQSPAHHRHIIGWWIEIYRCGKIYYFFAMFCIQVSDGFSLSISCPWLFALLFRLFDRWYSTTKMLWNHHHRVRCRVIIEFWWQQILWNFQWNFVCVCALFFLVNIGTKVLSMKAEIL